MRIILVIAASALAASSLGGQQVPDRVPNPEIAVSAVGEAKATPDRAVITLGVQSRAESASAAARENAAMQRAVLDTLRAMGFRNEQLTTANFNVRPEYAPPETRQQATPRVVGYVVSNTVQVTLHEAERAGEVVDAALAKGANTVHGLNFMLSDAAPARRDAIRDAVAKARAEGETLARAAGGTLGRLLELSTAQSGPEMRVMARAMGGVAGGMVTPVEPGQATVTAVVSARWEFVPGR